MSRLLRRSLTAAFLVLATAMPAIAQERCGTADLDLALQEQVRVAVEGMSGGPVIHEGIIQVAFHVIHNGTIGNIPQSWIDDQMLVLNAAYAPLGVTFQLAVVNRVLNATWFTATDGSAAETAMHNALAVDPAHYMNFYSINPGGGLLGWAYYPVSYPESDKHHSVNVHYNSLPGGTLVPYHLGDTGTHEVGHYLGLFHTFQSGCGGLGDQIADTPAEASPAFGCPVGRNTCAAAGLDPIENFMDYTDDTCMYQFTPNQFSRMDAQLALYRPSLLANKPVPTVQRSWGQLKVAYR